METSSSASSTIGNIDNDTENNTDARETIETIIANCAKAEHAVRQFGVQRKAFKVREQRRLNVDVATVTIAIALLQEEHLESYVNAQTLHKDRQALCG